MSEKLQHLHYTIIMALLTDAERKQQQALLSLLVSSEADSTPHNPFSEVNKLQTLSCTEWSCLEQYFECAIHYERPELRVQAEAALKETQELNKKITKETAECIMASPQASEINERSFNFHLPVLQRLVVVARRAWELVADSKRERERGRGSTEQYEQLRNNAVYLCCTVLGILYCLSMCLAFRFLISQILRCQQETSITMLMRALLQKDLKRNMFSTASQMGYCYADQLIRMSSLQMLCIMS
jgi:hypothetical protein